MAEYKNFTDNIITFVKGDSSKYHAGIAQGKYVNDIFFCTDQRTIFAQGQAYGLTEEESQLIETLDHTLVGVEYNEASHTLNFTTNRNEVIAIPLSLASATVNGLMSTGHYSKLEGIEEGAEVNIIENITTDSEKIILTGWSDKDDNATIEIAAITVDPATVSNNRTATIQLHNTLSQFAAKNAVFTRKEVMDKIKENVTKAYKVMGSLTNEELVAMSLKGHEVGEVYNMTTAGKVTTVGGEGAAATLGDDTFPAGTNFVIVDFNGDLAWDALAGNFDTSALEEELRLANIAIQANKDAIDAEVLRSTNADKEHSDELARIMDDEIGVRVTNPLDPDNFVDFPADADQTLHQRIDKLYYMLGELKMEGQSWTEFILNITDSKYVAGGAGEIGTDGKVPTLAEIEAATDCSSLIDNYVDVAKLIKELISNDKLTAEDLAKEIENRTNADTKIREDFAAADSALKEDLEGQLDTAKKIIDDYKVNGKKISTSPVLNGGDIEITGYSKLEAVGEQVAIAEDDTVNEAVAKLEKNIALAVAGQTTGLGEVRDRLDIIEEDLNDDAGIAAKPGQGLLEIVEGLVGNGEGSVEDQIEDAMDALKDGGNGSTWDDMVLTDDKSVTHDTTLTGLKAYVDAQDDAHLEVAKTYTDNEIAKALTWYEAD